MFFMSKRRMSSPEAVSQLSGYRYGLLRDEVGEGSSGTGFFRLWLLDGVLRVEDE